MLIALTVALAQSTPAEAQPARPNVVLMLADNLGYGDLSVYNGGIRGGMRTPNIDRLASEGMRFTQFLVEPGCTPTRSGLQTGRYSIRSGLSLIIPPGGSGGLQPEEVTLGELFKSVGYSTTYVGKWHLGPGAGNQPQNQGYDQWLLGFAGSTDGTLYASSMAETNAPEAMRKALGVSILEARGPGEAKRVRAYDREYRRRIESDIAKTSSAYIKEQARNGTPFFLMIGWTRPHFPNDAAPEFVGASGTGEYGDSVVELDHRTGEVLDAIEQAGIEDNTIVIWISDNGPTTTATALDELHAGSSGPFRGELGDAYEGSIRTAGMIRWPGRIAPAVSNEMFAVHDVLPTLAQIIGAEVPKDRPIDGVDQAAFLLGEQEQSSRNHLLTFLGDRLVAVRWNQWRIYPVEFLAANTNPATGGYMGTMRETAGFPQIYNIEADPKERVNVAHTGAGWVMGPYLQLVAKYRASLKDHPNPPAASVTRF
ncbi:MAG: arylsulfatase [Planctomycetota bacterium]|jgi:arylsulfatase